MQKLTYLFCLGCIISCILSCQAEHSAQRETPSEQQQYERLVSLSGSITETLFALGQGEHIIGIDVTSTYPAEQLKGMARLGHVKQLNVEALLQLQPDLVLAELTAETSAALRQLEDAGIDVVVGVLKTKAKELNKRFFNYHNNKRPYVILKWAKTQDGFIDVDRSDIKHLEKLKREAD